MTIGQLFLDRAGAVVEHVFLAAARCSRVLVHMLAIVWLLGAIQGGGEAVRLVALQLAHDLPERFQEAWPPW